MCKLSGCTIPILHVGNARNYSKSGCTLQNKEHAGMKINDIATHSILAVDTT